MLLRGIERAYGYGKRGRGETSSHSDGVVAVDWRGNVAAFLHTINASDYWGSGLFVDGVSISNAGCWAQWHISQAGPDRPGVFLAPPLLDVRREHVGEATIWAELPPV